MALTLIPLSLWALLMSIASVTLPVKSGLLALATGLLPFGLWSWRQLRLDERRRHALKCAAGIIDITRARFAHFEGATGIVLDPDARRLTVSIGTRTGRYDFAQVRKWQINAPTQELSLWLHDTENPAWHVAMSGEQTRGLWAGYLGQQIDEGRKPAPRVQALDYAAH